MFQLGERILFPDELNKNGSVIFAKVFFDGIEVKGIQKISMVWSDEVSQKECTIHQCNSANLPLQREMAEEIAKIGFTVILINRYGDKSICKYVNGMLQESFILPTL